MDVFFPLLEGWQCFDGFAGLLFRQPDFIKTLQIEPKFRRCAKKMGQAQCVVAGDGPPPIQDVGEAVGRNIELSSQFGRAHPQLFQLFGLIVPRGKSQCLP